MMTKDEAERIGRAQADEFWGNALRSGKHPKELLALDAAKLEILQAPARRLPLLAQRVAAAAAREHLRTRQEEFRKLQRSLKLLGMYRRGKAHALSAILGALAGATAVLWWFR